jgi:hypothetical protein
MRVGVISPIAWRTPPRAYGPWEQVASNVAEGLVARGHEVTLFATADSVTAGHLEAIAPAGYEENAQVTPKVYEALHIARPWSRRIVSTSSLGEAIALYRSSGFREVAAFNDEPYEPSGVSWRP